MRRLLIVFFLLFSVLPVSAQQSGKVKLLCQWDDTSGIQPNYIGRFNDVWGFIWKGVEYGVIGSTEGAHIIDINNCRQVAFQRGRAAGPSIVHRDYKTFGHYLYAVCDEGQSSLQVFDYSYLPDSVHLVYESDTADFLRAHNIFIDTATAKLYACPVKGQASPLDFMRVYSLANPASPQLLGRWNTGDVVHDVYVRNDTAYCSSSNYGYMVVDFSDASHPIILSELLFYPYKGYNHSSWVGTDGIGVMADETHGMPIKVLDTRNLADIQVTATFSPRPGDVTCIPHNPYLRGHFAYVSYYFDGLQIYDLSDPQNPLQAGFYDTYPGESFQGFGGAWGCYPFLPSGRVLVSDIQTGLYVLDVDEATGRTRAQDVVIYPNPASTVLMIEAPAAGLLEVMIYDAAGKLMLREKPDAAAAPYLPVALPLPAFMPAGWYVARITTAEGAVAKPFLKK